MPSKSAGTKLASLLSKVRETLSNREGVSGLVRRGLAAYIPTTCPHWLVLIRGSLRAEPSRSLSQTQELLIQSMSISWGSSWDPPPWLFWEALMLVSPSPLKRPVWGADSLLETCKELDWPRGEAAHTMLGHLSASQPLLLIPEACLLPRSLHHKIAIRKIIANCH